MLNLSWGPLLQHSVPAIYNVFLFTLSSLVVLDFTLCRTHAVNRFHVITVDGFCYLHVQPFQRISYNPTGGCALVSQSVNVVETYTHRLETLPAILRRLSHSLWRIQEIHLERTQQEVARLGLRSRHPLPMPTPVRNHRGSAKKE